MLYKKDCISSNYWVHDPSLAKKCTAFDFVLPAQHQFKIFVVIHKAFLLLVYNL